MKNKRRALTLIEALTAICVTSIVISVLLPTLGAVRGKSEETVSADNLRQMGLMHRSYANDFNGRQLTLTPDDLSIRLEGGPYHDSYDLLTAPPVLLGFDCNRRKHTIRRGWAIQPFWLNGNCAIGNWRVFHTQPFNTYANGKVYDRLFFAPKDASFKFRSHGYLFDSDCQWPDGASFYFSTYAMSLAAMVSPEVYRGASKGGSQKALDLPYGHRSPNLDNARYPDLKTHMIEHYWMNPQPEEWYIPRTGHPGVPWYFNMSDRAENYTLFFDGSVRRLPNMEVLESNDRIVRAGEDPLWADDPACFGDSGYLTNYALPPSSLKVKSFVEQVPSHHIFTRDGILGRDTTENK